MTLKCYIIDDQWPCIRLLRNYIERTAGLELAGTATGAETVIREIESGHFRADLTFLDIEMPGTTGLELAQYLLGKTRIIFTTGHREYGPEAFEMKAMDYLLKPISYERFLKSVDNLVKHSGTGAPAILPDIKKAFTFIPGDGKMNWVKIQHDEIIYLRSASNYIKFIFPDASRLSYMSMDRALSLLPADHFIRVHKSYAVNLNKVKNIEASFLHMITGETIPIGRNYKDLLMRSITNK